MLHTRQTIGFVSALLLFAGCDVGVMGDAEDGVEGYLRPPLCSLTAPMLDSLLPVGTESHRALTSGSWSSAATWGGSVPGNDARVVIPVGVVVTVGDERTEKLQWILVEGKLRFDPSVDTQLLAETIGVEHGGILEMGTATAPVAVDKTAVLEIVARSGEPIDHATDPLELGRGLITHGLVELNGAAKTAFVPLSKLPAVGATTITVDKAPTGWRAGDKLVLTATKYGEDETFSLVSASGMTITLDKPIQNARVYPTGPDGQPYAGLALHLANLTRNVEIRSSAENAGDPALQGHVMLMHHGGHMIRNAAFLDLGRTIAFEPVTDPTVDETGVRDPGTDPTCGLAVENVRGRYALHFHNGDPSGPASVVEGAVVAVARGAGLKIGFINHSSNVAFRRNVAYQIDGSGFFTEEGDETGEFRENIAIHSTGSGHPVNEQPSLATEKNCPEIFNSRRLDFGHRGSGFWLQAGGPDVIDNVASGQASSGFAIFPRGLNFKKPDLCMVQFLVANLKGDASWAGDEIDIGPTFVPALFQGNTAYAVGNPAQKYAMKSGQEINTHGLTSMTTFPLSPMSELTDFLAWNIIRGVDTAYTGHWRFQNVRILSDHSLLGVAGKGGVLGLGLIRQGGQDDELDQIEVCGFGESVNLGPFSTLDNLTICGVPAATGVTTGKGELLKF